MKILIFLLVILFSSVVEAKTLYVDPNGNDSTIYTNNTEATPWATLGRAAWGNTDRAFPNSNEAAKAGDIVIVKAGTYTSPGSNDRMIPSFNPINSGSVGNPITFKASGLVTLQLISGTGPTIGAGAPNASPRKSYITWDGFYIDEANATYHADTGVITIFYGDNIIIKNCIVKGVNSSVIDNHNGIRVEESTNILLENNKIYDVLRVDNSHNAAGIMLYFTDNVTIRNNEIHNTISGIFPKGGDNTNVYIYNNLIYNAAKGIRTSYTISGEVHNNIIKDCKSGGMGFNIAEGSKNIIYANNTVDNCYYGMFLNNNVGWLNLSFQNNIITNTTSAIWVEDITTLPELTLNYNNYYIF